MASSSPEADPSQYFGFRDLYGFKDFVGYVFLCAPDEFPADDWLEPEQQMTCERAFLGLRYGLGLAVAEQGESDLLKQCHELVEDAAVKFSSGDNSGGRAALDEVRSLLKRLPSQ